MCCHEGVHASVSLYDDALTISMDLLYGSDVLTSENRDCPALNELSGLTVTQDDYLNQALEDAAQKFEQNPTTSSANVAFGIAVAAAPSSVSSSLYCLGYGGINSNSLPSWLTAVPTSYVSMVLQEQSAYQSLIHSFVSEARASDGITTTATAASDVPATATASTMSSGASRSHSASASGPASSPASATGTTGSSATASGQPSASPSHSWASKSQDKQGALVALFLSAFFHL